MNACNWGSDESAVQQEGYNGDGRKEDLSGCWSGISNRNMDEVRDREETSDTQYLLNDSCLLLTMINDDINHYHCFVLPMLAAFPESCRLLSAHRTAKPARCPLWARTRSFSGLHYYVKVLCSIRMPITIRVMPVSPSLTINMKLITRYFSLGVSVLATISTE